MKTLHLSIISLIVVSCLMVASQAYAVPYMSPQDLYKQSEMVFYGQVISVGPGPGPNSNYYLVKIVTSFKNPQTSDYVTVEGNKIGAGIQYQQFDPGDNAIFYIQKIDGINAISPYSQKAGNACDVHSFLGPALLPGETQGISIPASSLRLMNSEGNPIVGSVGINHEIVLNYDDIWNNYPESRTIPVDISLVDSDSHIVFYKKQSMGLHACDGPGLIQWNFVPTHAGKYTLTLIVDNKTTTSTVFYVENNSDEINTHTILSPQKQFKSGIALRDIQCGNDMVLVIKSKDASPICITSQTAEILKHRNWGYQIGKNIILDKPSDITKSHYKLDPQKEKVAREKQTILENALMTKESQYEGFQNRVHHLPWSSIGYDYVDNALEVTILPDYFNTNNLPKYFEEIRSIVGNDIDIALSPLPYATPN